ncbi:ferrous iron transport protein A [Arcanobacterium wilhelmae]|uniref:Ferrous iron transport protein A n=1 Tax=Arcanobacterium wilhelmae TaxID=1803177 RepID=A0ABT9NAA9_9ACTO|nr:FeoA family protein [Arcanobacterium wilhelmae]MDP9800627.1 ferrous iron transport protein A [Arcanobacterium wilhelmae]WFN90034.1 FeoA family protein [Arcanobacterium wilhelmae]
MRLSDCPTKVALRLTEITLPQESILRMRELGVRPGARAWVTHRTLAGLILNVSGSRVAIDRMSARKIVAEECA